MGALYRVADGGEIARRRRLVPAGRLVEAWPDLYARGDVWMGESAKVLLDAAGGPMPAALELGAAAVPIYYGPRLSDLDSLPAEESLQSRVLSAHGIAVAWITRDRFGERTQYEPQSPADPVFYLRRPAGTEAHVWRLFRARREAVQYMAEYFGEDAEAREWAQGLCENWDDMIKRYTVHR